MRLMLCTLYIIMNNTNEIHIRKGLRVYIYYIIIRQIYFTLLIILKDHYQRNVKFPFPDFVMEIRFNISIKG